MHDRQPGLGLSNDETAFVCAMEAFINRALGVSHRGRPRNTVALVEAEHVRPGATQRAWLALTEMYIDAGYVVERRSGILMIGRRPPPPPGPSGNSMTFYEELVMCAGLDHQPPQQRLRVMLAMARTLGMRGARGQC